MHLPPALVFFALTSSVFVKGMRVPARGDSIEDGSRAACSLLVGGPRVGIVVDGGTAPGFVATSAGAVPGSTSTTRRDTASVEFGDGTTATPHSDRANVQQSVDEHCIVHVGDSDLPSVPASTGCPVGNPLLDRAFAQDTATSATYLLSRREDLGDNRSWVYRNMPWIVVIGGLLLVFSTAAMFIYFRGRTYQSLDAPAPEGLGVAVSFSREPMYQLKNLERAHPATPPGHSLRDPMTRTNRWQATKQMGDGGDWVGKPRRLSEPLAGRMSLGEDSVMLLDHDAPPGLSSLPVAATLPSDKPPVPSTPSAPVAAPESLGRVAPLAPMESPLSPPSAPSAVAVASDTADSVISPPVDVSTLQPSTPDYNPLHEPRDRSANETIMFTSYDSDEESLPNPYDDSSSAHCGSPINASNPTLPSGTPATPAPGETGYMPTPLPSFRIRPLPTPPVREIRRQPSSESMSTLDTTPDSRSSTLYVLPAFEISSTSLSINLSPSPTPRHI